MAASKSTPQKGESSLKDELKTLEDLKAKLDHLKIVNPPARISNSDYWKLFGRFGGIGSSKLAKQNYELSKVLLDDLEPIRSKIVELGTLLNPTNESYNAKLARTDVNFPALHTEASDLERELRTAAKHGSSDFGNFLKYTGNITGARRSFRIHKATFQRTPLSYIAAGAALFTLGQMIELKGTKYGNPVAKVIDWHNHNQGSAHTYTPTPNHGKTSTPTPVPDNTSTPIPSVYSTATATATQKQGKSATPTRVPSKTPTPKAVSHADKNPPSLELMAKSDAEGVHATIDASDAEGPVQWDIYLGTKKIGHDLSQYESGKLPAGKYNLMVDAVDKAGNHTKKSYSFTVAGAAPPVVPTAKPTALNLEGKVEGVD